MLDFSVASENSLSIRHKLKTWLRNEAKRLTALVVINIRKLHADRINVNDLCENDFVRKRNEYSRPKMFSEKTFLIALF